MVLQWRVFIQGLLKKQHWLEFYAKFAKVNFVCINIVISQLLDLDKLFNWVRMLIYTETAVFTNLSFNVGPDLLSGKHQVIALVLNLSAPI